MRQLPDLRTLWGARALMRLALAVGLLVLAPSSAAASTPSGASGADVVAAAPRPGDECADTPEGEANALCNEGGGGGGAGPDLALILMVLGGALVVGVLLLIAAFLYLRRQAGAPLQATDPGSEWWTCRNCGKANMVGTPRCFSCATWQR